MVDLIKLREKQKEKVKSKELYEKEKANIEKRKQLEKLKKNGIDLSGPYIKPEKPRLSEILKDLPSDKWDKIFKSSDAKRFIYLVKEAHTFRGKNIDLDLWIEETFQE